MAELDENNLTVPIVWADEEKTMIDTDAMREDFEALMAELEEDE